MRRSPAARACRKHPAAPHPAVDHSAADRAGDLHLRLRHSDRGGLSFLGAGTPPDIPTWGNMIASCRLYLSRAPWTIFCARPGARARRAGRQPRRRRPARPARPAPRAADVMATTAHGRHAAARAFSDLQTYFFTRTASRARSTASRSTVDARRDARHRRRIGLRQERDGAVDPAAAAADRSAASSAARSASRARPADARRSGDARRSAATASR